MCVGDLSNVVGSAQIHTGLSTSTWRGRGPGAGRFVRCLGPVPLCVVLLVQANRNDASDRCLGPAAECECALVCECALLCECECECGCACYCQCACECEWEGRRSLELVEIFQTSIVFFRFTPVCRSRCGTRGRSAAPAPGGSYGSWDHSPCECFCLCRPIERTLPTGLWDQQRRVRSECECECECGFACYCACACECECECVSRMFQMRWVARRFTPVCRSRCGARGADRNPGAGTADLAKSVNW